MCLVEKQQIPILKFGSKPQSTAIKASTLTIPPLMHFTIKRERERGIMVYNATIDNISAILWQSVFFGGGNLVLGENNRPAASH